MKAMNKPGTYSKQVSLLKMKGRPNQRRIFYPVYFDTLNNPAYHKSDYSKNLQRTGGAP